LSDPGTPAALLVRIEDFVLSARLGAVMPARFAVEHRCLPLASLPDDRGLIIAVVAGGGDRDEIREFVARAGGGAVEFVETTANSLGEGLRLLYGIGQG
jgi:hypothetical protein